MKLLIVREPLPQCTFGVLYINGMRFCETLEDIDRQLEVNGAEAKIPGDTCTPRGAYQVLITYSNRFKKEMMQVMNVPYFQGIRIHAGNTTADTEGCILLGSGRGREFLLNSRATVQKLFEKVEAALDRGEEVTLEIQ